jgi:tetratricopeptide (TPR) repeat protein
LPPYEDLSFSIHFPQLFQTIQIQSGYHFKQDKLYFFHCPDCCRPFSLQDIEHITPLYKYQLSLSGIISTIEKSSEAFLAAKMYQDALHAYQLKLTFLNIFLSQITQGSSPNVSNTHPYKLLYQRYSVIYLIAFCYYSLQQYSVASSLLKTTLEDMSPQDPLMIRYIMLLMCIEFKSQNIQLSLSHFETVRQKINYHYGSRHPLLCLLTVLLADLYHCNGMHNYAKVMILYSLEFAERIIGRNSLLYAMLHYKLGVLDLYLHQFPSAEESLHTSLQLFQIFTSRGGVFQQELSLCYHGLSYIYHSYELIQKSIKYSLKSLSLSVHDEETTPNTYISMHTVNTILQLGDLYEKNQQSSEAIQLYCDGWNIVWEYLSDYEIPAMFLVLVAKIVKGYFQTQPLQTKMFFDTIATELIESSTIQQREWDIGCQYISRLILQKTPLVFITEFVEDLLKQANPG